MQYDYTFLALHLVTSYSKSFVALQIPVAFTAVKNVSHNISQYSGTLSLYSLTQPIHIHHKWQQNFSTASRLVHFKTGTHKGLGQPTVVQA